VRGDRRGGGCDGDVVEEMVVIKVDASIYDLSHD